MTNKPQTTDLTITLQLVLSRFSSGLFRAMFAMKEIENGKEIHRRVSARMATTSGLTAARQLIRSIDERGGLNFHQI